MIPREWQFFSPEGALTPGGPHSWVVIDWDLRRWIQVTGPAEALPDEDDAIDAVARYIDRLGPEEHAFIISRDREFVSISDDDPTWEIRYPEPSTCLQAERLLPRSELIEIDRMSVCTDLVELRSASEKKEVLAFKYTIIQQRVQFIWNEVHILNALKDNPLFVSLHSVIVDDITGKMLGFTSEYIAGGTLDEYCARREPGPFYFRWLEQLTAAIDDLNLGFGVMHQDIAPRNILINPATNDIKIFDFDRSALIGAEGQEPGGNDIDGVIFTVYEALTGDEQYRDEIPFFEQNPSEIESLSEWTLRVPLEGHAGGLAAYRRYLNIWAAERKTTRCITHYSQATHSVDWPVYTQPGKLMVRTETGYTFQASIRRRRDAWRVGDYVTVWERPRQK